jgi:hypothetical protein
LIWPPVIVSGLLRDCRLLVRSAMKAGGGGGTVLVRHGLTVGFTPTQTYRQNSFCGCNGGSLSGQYSRVPKTVLSAGKKSVWTKIVCSVDVMPITKFKITLDEDHRNSLSCTLSVIHHFLRPRLGLRLAQDICGDVL